MEGLLPTTGSTFQLILEHLWGVPLVMSESLRQVPGLPAFPWEILVCAAMLVLIVNRRHTLRSEKMLGKRCSVHNEVYRKCCENIESMTQADEALKCLGPQRDPPKSGRGTLRNSQTIVEGKENER
ncbi:hypothetical protein HPG69_005127 [Diceros bicornis minor]|uniref:Uncharacterized protein n=1 Tax=Diceros bicornis minor TaxID=77932 RepID=A0A7J7EFP4_DICBM|nr:hypothetical protein HPG69_005127 [Diceros bicornis minor]